jgi:putative MATE family efflux protein
MSETQNIEPEAPGSEPRPAIRRVDLTQGGLRRGIFMLAWPIVLSSAQQWVMGVADVKMVGYLGPEAIAAVGMAGNAFFTFMVIMLAVSTGTQVLVAQYTGQRDHAKVSAVARQSIIMTVAATLLLMTPLGLIFSRAILRLMGADDAVIADALPYMQLMFAGTIFMNLNFILGAILQGAGDTITPLLILVGINVTHIFCNWLFIFGIGPFPRLGVAGAAWGVIISRALGVAVATWALTSGRFAVHVAWRESWALHLPTWGKTLYIGLPNALQGLARNLSFTVMYKVLTLAAAGGAAGTAAVAAFTIAGQIRGVSIMAGLAMMGAAMTVVGQNCGAQQLDRAERGGWWTTRISMGFSLVAVAIYVAFARVLVRAFTDDAMTLAVGIPALRILAIGEPALVGGMALAGALRGAGDTWAPLWASLLSTTILSPVIAYILALNLSMGPTGVWLGYVIGMTLGLVILGLMFRSGRWKRLRIAT